MPQTPEDAFSLEGNDSKVRALASAARTIIECIGEDPDREGLRDTPVRYAKAMLYFTKGYQDNIEAIVNGAIFNEDCDEMVVVKDIPLFSLCEHHLVPFTGKVCIMPSCRKTGVIALTIRGRFISVISPTAKCWVSRNWPAWPRCSPGDCRYKSASRSK